jgi:hypothetical protein
MHTTHPLLRLLFPEQPRRLPWRRFWQGLIRSLHILCLGVLSGGLVIGAPFDILFPWLLGTVFSGLALLMMDMFSSFIVLFELRGVSVLVKLPLVAALPLLNETMALVLVLVMIVFSTLISHGTRGLRHTSFAPLAWRERLDYHISGARTGHETHE